MSDVTIPDGWVRVDTPEPGDQWLGDPNGGASWVVARRYIGPNLKDPSGRTVVVVDEYSDVVVSPLPIEAVWVRRVPTVTIELSRDVAEAWAQHGTCSERLGELTEAIRQALGREGDDESAG